MLNSKQLKCINLIVTENKTQKEIAKQINITEKTICEWKKQEEFKNELRKQLQENFSSLAIEAQKQLSNLLKSKNEIVKMQAVKDILDRAGFKPKERIELNRATDQSIEEVENYIREKECKQKLKDT